ncbi:MAG TPA: L-histidine N(alpha)-methyltransferase [Blastocatellia bacterium]|nr:L-histidine N(alpha)-methyltransferase [Blastocatellia bacterium]
MLRNAIAARSGLFTLHRIQSGTQTHSFARDVKIGLSSDPKYLQPKYFYDDLGSRLFAAISCLPEYYLTRAESEILQRRSRDIIRQAIGTQRQPVRLIELGSGSAEKSRYLIEAILECQAQLEYLPIDISDSSLERSSDDLLHAYPGLSITAFAGEYFAVLAALNGAGLEHRREYRNVVLFLGSNIGNFDGEESVRFLKEIRGVLNAGDFLFLGADLRKGSDVLIPAYDDALGVTAAFNRNLLVRINRELDGDFDISTFDHMAMWSEAQSRVEMHLVSRHPQQVRIGAIDLTVNFDWRESIHTESSHKFDLDSISVLARDSGFSLVETWYDSAHRFSFNMLVASGQ